MLKKVVLKPKHLADYKELIAPDLFNELTQLGRNFRDKRILHINATSDGGGVAEILCSFVPLLRDLGIEAQWQAIEAPEEFFRITKQIHNNLQGEPIWPTPEQWQIYEQANRELAASIDPKQWDFIVVHDPQPAALPLFAVKNKVKWVWRCHIDASQPAKDHDHFQKYLQPYNGSIFTLPDYVFGTKGHQKVGIIPVAIDPLAPKNQEMPRPEASQRLADYGIKPDQPLAVQVSRFDYWKDQLGTIKIWQLAKKRIPDLQLVLIGNTASDDPEGGQVLAEVMKAAENYKDLFVLADIKRESELLVNAAQTLANVVLQKSVREGFGLIVSEALWKGTPVIGSRAGGIPLQIQNEVNGYLVDTIEAATKYLIDIVEHPDKSRKMGLAGREWVRQNFLLPRMLRDDLKFLQSLL